MMLEVFLKFFIYIFSTFLVSYLLGYLIDWVGKSAWSEKQDWKKALLHVVSAPMKCFIWITGFFLSFDPVMDFFQVGWWSQKGMQLKGAIWTLLAIWLSLRWKNELERFWKLRVQIESKSSLEKATVDAVGRLLSFAILLVGGLTTLQVMGMPIESFLAFGAVGAAGIAWASTDVVKNFFGGFMIHIMRPFAVGDWINSPEKEIEGVVEQIGWYQTQIRTFDRRPIYVPNGIFPSIVLRNPSRMSNRRIFADIGVRYEDAKLMQPIIASIEEMLKTHPSIDQSKILMVHFDRFDAYALNINVYCFTKQVDWAEWRKEQQGIFLKIIEIIESFGAKIALPTRHLQMMQGEGVQFDRK